MNIIDKLIALFCSTEHCVLYDTGSRKLYLPTKSYRLYETEKSFYDFIDNEKSLYVSLGDDNEYFRLVKRKNEWFAQAKRNSQKITKKIGLTSNINFNNLSVFDELYSKTFGTERLMKSHPTITNHPKCT